MGSRTNLAPPQGAAAPPTPSFQPPQTSTPMPSVMGNGTISGPSQPPFQMDSFTPPQMPTMTSPAFQLPMPTMTSPAMTGGARPMGQAMGGGQAQRCPTCGK